MTFATYMIHDDYGDSASFFDRFTFWTEPDPSHGYVQYVDQATAEGKGFISMSDGVAYLGVDYTSVVVSGGRQSVRLTSRSQYNHGLYILDLSHMPGSVCGSWPAFWMVGPNWPQGGEIDIIEGVSQSTNNAMTLHTSDGCSIAGNGFTGTIQSTNCFVGAGGQGYNTGCGIQLTSNASYGDGLNNADGGVYGMEWTSGGFKSWFFTRGNIPLDILSDTPDPLSWGTPDAAFAGDCNFDTHFNNMQIVFDTTFCGDWAGHPDVWASSGTCQTLAPTCEEYVANNPTDFQEAYWEINALKIYQDARNTTARLPRLFPYHP
ncbi:hypothetical protein P175DRAFT_0534175 [Aspergillus ochraceoroseus IBT 24754]|nr:uncharacterized protein P175DRAFT_0534175 [Aspergillus ochraceoroseus IBT 24754]PTU19718.1 hypothetical protein P175DRAFT_0534175 [Aspergillus ochraceoroseus IBT 24754]